MIILGEINRKGICLKLGKRGEHNVTFFQFDYTEWQEKYGDGTLSLRLTQHGASTAYPVTLEYDGTIATYTVTKTDTSVAGDGKAELVYIVGEEEKIKKSVTYETYVEPSEDTGEAPDPYDDWLAHLEVLAGEVVQAKDDAEQAAESARQSAISAQRSEENAARSEQNAEEYAGRIENLTVSAQEASGTTPTVTKTIKDGVYNLLFGLVRGEKGNKGDKGNTGNDGITPDISIGEVETLSPSEDAYVTNTGTKENPVFDFGIPKGDTGEVSMEDFLKVAVTDEASGSGVVTIPDGANLPMRSLKVTLTPQQDGTPWIGTDHDTTPYLNRAMPTQSNSYNRESGVIVGGTIALNQLVEINPTSISRTANGVTFVDNRDGSYTFYTDANGATADTSNQIISRLEAIDNGVYCVLGNANGPTDSTWYMLDGFNGVLNYRYLEANINKVSGRTTPARLDLRVVVKSGAVITTPITVKPQVINLTAMLGTTIADYIYSLEQSSAGAGVAWFRKYFPEDYYPYSANTLQSVQATAHKTYDGDGHVIGNYALDSSVTLNGLFQLDNGELKAYGDVYASDGTITRHFRKINSLSSLSTWTRIDNSSLDVGYVFRASISYMAQTFNRLCEKYPLISGDGVANAIIEHGSAIDKVMIANTANKNIYIIDSTYADAESFRTSLTDVSFICELETPTTETAQAYTNPQIVDPDGTEEYVTANSVPVGHDSTYSLVCPISGYDEVSAVVSPTTSASDGQTYTADLGQTVYGGTVDLVSGEIKAYPYYASYNGETLTGEWISDRDPYVAGTSPSIGAQVVNIGAAPVSLTITPQVIEALKGVNNVWSNGDSLYLHYVADTGLFIIKKIDEVINNG